MSKERTNSNIEQWVRRAIYNNIYNKEREINKTKKKKQKTT